MIPSYRPSATVVVGYPLQFENTPSYDALEALSDIVDTHARKKLRMFGGNATYVDLIDWSGPADSSLYFLGVSVASTYGSPDTAAFTLDAVDRAFRTLAQQEALARTVLAALQKKATVGSNFSPVVALLFQTGSGQADATMYLGGEGHISEQDGHWRVSVDGNQKLEQSLNTTLNKKFPIDGDPVLAFDELLEWMHAQKKPYDYNVHGSIDEHNAGFLYGKHVSTLLEGCTERVYSREAFERLGSRTRATAGPRVSLVVRSVHY